MYPEKSSSMRGVITGLTRNLATSAFAKHLNVTGYRMGVTPCLIQGRYDGIQGDTLYLVDL